MENYSFLFLQIFFGFITLASIAIFIRACGIGRKQATIAIIAWITIQGVLTFNEFYLNTTSFPPRFALLLGPTIITILILFTTKKGKLFLDNINPVTITYLHTVRIPVEFTLFWLFGYKLIPEVMTFEGRNFDIISGITAPFIAYFGMVKGKLPKSAILIWNFICLGLLINVVGHGIVSAPSPFQQISFEQPNIAILTFPFSWLACCIVPLVLLSHLVCIRSLVKK